MKYATIALVVLLMAIGFGITMSTAYAWNGGWHGWNGWNNGWNGGWNGGWHGWNGGWNGGWHR